MSNVALLVFLLGVATKPLAGVPLSGVSLSVGPLTGEPGAGAPEADARCEVETQSGAPPAADDVVRASTACQTARTRFAELFGDPVPTVRIILWEEAHYRMGVLRGEAAIFWPSSQAMTPRTDDKAAAENHVAAQWREVLPHEISHLLLAVRLFPDRAATPAGGYGTPLPDWLDEAVAIWAEPLESRQRRVEQARELPAELRDLRTILTTPHPATGQSAAYISRDGTARPADFTLWAFYPQAISVLTFVHEHGGTAATRELARRLVGDPGVPVAPADPLDPQVLAGLPGLPADFEGVEAAWNEWIGR